MQIADYQRELSWLAVRVTYRGWKGMVGKKKRVICGMVIPLLVCFQLEVSLGLWLLSAQSDGVWCLTGCIARCLRWASSGEAGKVCKVPWFTPLQTCMAGPGLEKPWLHGQSMSSLPLQRCMLCYQSQARRSCVQEDQAVVLVLAHLAISAQAFLHFVHLPKSLWGLQQTNNWLSGSFAAFSGCSLPEAPRDLVCYVARRGEKTAWNGRLFLAKEIHPAE